MNWSRGVFRLWLVVSVLWSLAIGGLCWIELKEGPFSTGLVTDTVVSTTGEPVTALEGNSFRNLVPVDQVISWRRLSLVWFGPPLLTFLFGYTLLWVGRGFRRERSE
jgi:hypothetical protein